MAKRGAEKELNHDNWDCEEEDEEAGEFRFASKDIMEKREIKKAKRRLGTEDQPKSAAAVFKGFSFDVKGSTSAASKPFSFASVPSSATTTDPTKPVFSGFGFNSAATSTATLTATSTSAAVSTATTVTASKKCSPEKTSSVGMNTNKESEYRRSLRILNESVLRWITEHVQQNPHCILTPVFKDYENYIKELERDYLNATADVSSDCSTVSAKVGASTTNLGPGFQFVSPKVSPSATPSMSTSSVSSAQAGMSDTVGAGFSGFGFKAATSEQKVSTSSVLTSSNSSGFSFTNTVLSAAAPLGFGITAQEKTGGISSTSGFTFPVQSSKAASSTPAAGFGFSFQPSNAGASSSTSGNGEGAQSSGQNAGGDDENYVPPKAEMVDIKEDDAFYTVRCKLYCKIKNEFQDRGLGNLYLKPCGDKTQLLVRAGTTLGNILLNILLSKGIPTSQQGNKVTMVCIPNPPLDDKNPDNTPVCMLIRVKTEEEAQTLLSQINDHKV